MYVLVIIVILNLYKISRFFEIISLFNYQLPYVKNLLHHKHFLVIN